MPPYRVRLGRRVLVARPRTDKVRSAFDALGDVEFTAISERGQEET
jgi:hypothetical protein